MSIEDVDYMKLNSIKENYTFIIDSKFRNHEEYPEPNNYTINFDIPFKNVFGIEILDVTIPKTMYNVDINTNMFKIYINTTKNPIDNFINTAHGLIWINNNTIMPSHGNELINYPLADNLIYKNIFTLSEWESFNITNLNINNYIKVINPLKWNNINITNKTILLFNPSFSYNILSNFINNITQEVFDNYNINNFRSYNAFPYLDYSLNPHLKWYEVVNPLNNNLLGLEWENIGTKKPNNVNEIINDKLSNALITKQLFSPEEYNAFNINDLYQYSFILSNGYYFKPVDNYNIGTKWIEFGINIPTEGSLINNINLSDAIYTKYITNDIYNFTNTHLNNLDFTFDIDIDDYIAVPIGLRWINMGITIPTDLINENEINNPLLKNLFTLNKNKDIHIFTKEEWISYNILNLNINSYIFADRYWIPSIYYFKTDGLFIRDTLDSNSLKNALNDKNNLLGLNWEYISNDEPLYGRNINNLELSNKLIVKTTFTDLEWNNFNILDIKYDDYILSNNKYYRPKYIEFTQNEWNSFNISSDLNVENFVKINDKYFKMVPNYYSSAEIFYFLPNDKFDISKENDYNNFLNNFFEEFTITIPIGNYTIAKLILTINEQFRNINLLIRNRNINNIKFLNNENSFDLLLQCTGNSIPADLTNILKFKCSRKIILDMNNSSANEILGFYSNVSKSNTFLTSFERLHINNIKNYEKFYHSIIENQNNNIIISPGIVYLIGSKYILLKCPEIETHLYGSLSYTKNTIGLAKIRTSHWGLNEETNPLFKLQLREFHPIGKLSKLTLRFENADGSLYNFRGVNHNIVFAIHYYSAKQNKIFKNSICNPEYKMNFIEYKYTQEEQEQESDDDDENNYSRINIDNYKKKEILYGGNNFNNGYEINYPNLKNNSHYNNSDSNSNSDSESEYNKQNCFGK
tara:strand:+ start:4054 stop:6816 length:2763 start_codon:yes stop_codon:yes gene_type:complete